MIELKVGEMAPQFSLQNQNEELVSLDDYKGQYLVLYFYPRDNTPGCTAQACNIRDNFESLKDADINILGISADSAKKHQNFISKFNLPFDLLVDSEYEMIKNYGVWKKKKFLGKEFMGIVRTSFIIDPLGKIVHIIKKVKTKDHSAQILEALGS